MIKLQDICREFQVGDQLVHALDHVNVEIAQGDYVSVMGLPAPASQPCST